MRVLRKARRRGVGSVLFGAISEHARSIGRTALYTIVRLDDADSNDYLRKRGFEVVLRVEEMSLSLGDAQPDATLPGGVEIVPFDAELDERVHPVAVEIDRDIPTPEPIAALSLEAWRDRMLGPGVLRELSFVALADDEVVGYAILGEAEPAIAEHWITGVRRDWRGRGLGPRIKGTAGPGRGSCGAPRANRAIRIGKRVDEADLRAARVYATPHVAASLGTAALVRVGTGATGG